METEFAIVGGGIVGLSVAYGLLCKGHTVTVFDEADNALRASRGNFGLVWVQGKGMHEPAYAQWSVNSAAMWRAFANDIERQTGTDLKLQQNGGYRFYLQHAALQDYATHLKQLANKLNSDYPFEVLEHSALLREEPHIGPNVAGAVLHQLDGHVNSLRLLQSLAKLVRQLGGQVHNNCTIVQLSAHANQFKLQNAQQREFQAAKVVLCAGLGTATLGPMLGFKAAVRPQRGQILITEKMAPLINRPSDVIRQVDEGGIQIGASSEEVGTDDRDTLSITAQLAHEARQLYPAIGQSKIVRHWAALRIMSPDGLPIYQQSSSHPGAFFITCHSGITLAATHARLLPLWLTSDSDAPDLTPFSESRFQ